MIDREYGKPDFPIVSNPFDDPNSPKTFSTELENTDTFSVQDIFDLGFLRTSPDKKIYYHKDKQGLVLYEIFGIDLLVKDKITRRITLVNSNKIVMNYILNTRIYGSILYNTISPIIADIQLIIDNF